MDLDIGDKVFYTRSTGLRVPAQVVGRSDEGYVELEYHQDGVRVVNHCCPMDAVSFGIPGWDSPPSSPSSPPADHLPGDASGGSPLRGRSPLRTSSPSPSRSHTPSRAASPAPTRLLSDDEDEDEEVRLTKRASQTSGCPYFIQNSSKVSASAPIRATWVRTQLDLHRFTHHWTLPPLPSS